MSQPKTQKEILESLGDFRVQERSLLDKIRTQLSSRHLFLAAVVIFFMILILPLLKGRRQSVPPLPPMGDPKGTSANHVIHFTRERPYYITIIREFPGVEEAIARFDSQPFIVIFDTISPDQLRSLDLRLKSSRREGIWFLVAQPSASNFEPSTPRLIVNPKFQSMVFGHSVEVMTTSSFTDDRFENRLSVGSGDVNTRIVFSLTEPVPRPSEINEGIRGHWPLRTHQPLILVTSRPTEKNIQILTIDRGIRTRSFSTPLCTIKPFEFSDWTWDRCGSP
jgi:hypothetical protein